MQCADGECISNIWWCNGEQDCKDNSDEMSCEEKQCPESEFKCANNECVPMSWRCDGYQDCRDDTDEAVSISSYLSVCSAIMFYTSILALTFFLSFTQV